MGASLAGFGFPLQRRQETPTKTAIFGRLVPQPDLTSSKLMERLCAYELAMH
jgi:hypothetical protein